jgi:hypothetical protein
VNLISSLVYVFALPFVAIATTYLYFDLAVEKEEEEPEARGRRGTQPGLATAAECFDEP